MASWISPYKSNRSRKTLKTLRARFLPLTSGRLMANNALQGDGPGFARPAPERGR